MGGPKLLLAGGGTGGHLYPALNIAAAVMRADPSARCFLLGGERGVEARVLPEAGYPYRLLPMEPLYRSRPWRNWRLLRTAPAVVRGVRRVLREFDPDVVVGTGGYVSGPAVALARLGGRRTAIQEQNAQPGLVTRALASRVDQLHLGYPEARDRLRIPDRVKVFAFGNPVAPPAVPRERPAFDWPEGRVLLVTGGSQGARAINERLLADLTLAAGPQGEARPPERSVAGEEGNGGRREADGASAADARSGPCARQGPGEAKAVASAAAPPRSYDWPDDLWVVWVAGPAHAELVAEGVHALPWAERIVVTPYIDGLGSQLGHAALAICRSGAMSIAELCAAGVPAVFVPLPTAAGGHQAANARAMVAAGAAEMREESALAPGELWSLCRSLLEDPEARRRMGARARERARPDAADRIAAALLELARSGDREAG